jgi:ribosomal biogenesis protein LAS1
VVAWKSRSGGKLPLAIECTVDLVAAHLADSVSFTPEVQLVVSMALVRFVNGMVDLNQKGLYARSVQVIAEEIGLPDWLVDLRHEATHANLPSQHTLRAGVNVALSWLREEYWEAQMKMHKDSEGKLFEMLENYQALSTKKKTKKKNIEKRGEKIHVFAQEITNFVATNNLW